MVIQVSLSPLTVYVHLHLHDGLLSVGNSTDKNMRTAFTRMWADMDVLTQVHVLLFSRIIVKKHKLLGNLKTKVLKF